MKDDIQRMYDSCIGEVEKATAKERVDKAASYHGNWNTGKKLAYADIARRLVDMGAKLILIIALLLTGCGTTIRYNPETGEVYYNSNTGKEFSNLAILRQANGDVLLEVNKYKGEGVPPIKVTLPNGVIVESGGGK